MGFEGTGSGVLAGIYGGIPDYTRTNGFVGSNPGTPIYAGLVGGVNPQIGTPQEYVAFRQRIARINDTAPRSWPTISAWPSGAGSVATLAVAALAAILILRRR